MSFRTRLTLLFVVAITALVAATSVATYLVVRSSLESSARKSALSLAKSAASIEDPGETSLDRLAGPGARIWLTDASGRVVAQSYSTSGSDSIGRRDRRRRSAVRQADPRRRDGRDRAAAMRTCCSPTSAIDSSLSTLFSTLLAVGAAVIAASAVVGALAGRRCAATDRADAAAGGRHSR